MAVCVAWNVIGFNLIRPCLCVRDTLREKFPTQPILNDKLNTYIFYLLMLYSTSAEGL